MLKNKKIQYFTLFFIFLFLAIAVIYAWTEPSALPPGDNVPPPLNVGSQGQAKIGGLILNTGGAEIGLIVQNGKVGIGTLTPGSTLSVKGELDMMGHKIKNVSEIDPVFKINNKKYVTYLPDSIGQKVMVVGKAQLKGEKLEIDLSKQKEGSDLWLFWQIVAKETVVPFVSSQSEASLYAYMQDSKLVVRLKEGEKNAKFSYLLIGTRLDHQNEDNLYEDQSVKYYIDIDKLRK